MPSSSSLSSLPAAVPPTRPSPYSRTASHRPRSRTSTLPPDPALASIGAIYIGWGKGQKDPAPLCGAKGRGRVPGEMAAGWLSHAPGHAARPRVQPQQRKPIAQLPLGALPPLPPLPLRPQATYARSPSLHDLAPSPAASTPLRYGPSPFALSPLATTSTPPDASSHSLASPPDLAFLEEALQKDRASSFDDTTLALPLVDSRPPSPKWAPKLAPADPAPSHQSSYVPGFTLSLATVPEYVEDIQVKDEDEGDDDEALWSAGEDPLWNCAATDVMSEASWAW